WGGTIFRTPLPLIGGRIGGPYELPPTRRPREDMFLPEQIRYLRACNFSAVGSNSRRNRGAVFAPAELATVDPHPVQNHGQTPGDRDDGSTHPAPLGHPYTPRLQPRPFPAVDEQ